MAERERASSRTPNSHPRTPNSHPRTPGPGPGHDPVRGGLRLLTELVAWVMAPWALWPHSILLAIGVVILLIGLPAAFSTPGDRPSGGGPVAAPGIVTILLIVAQLVSASWASWVLWPSWTAVIVTALCLVVVVTEQPRWRALTKQP